MVITLFALLADKSPTDADRLLDELIIDEGGQRCSAITIAARNGHDKVVRMLLTKFHPNLECEGTVKFDGYVIEGASPLWCAAGAGHSAVVRTLVSHGADVNHPTCTNSTPLRAACFDGRLDIVEFLVENGADIHSANKYNNTCLMIAAYKGFADIVRFLLARGADPDVRAHCGATALHFAAECGHVHIVRQLLDSRAAILRNEYGMTPLVAAAERTRSEVVEFLVSLPGNNCTRIERIEALELLGASYANDKDNYSLERAYHYLMRAMQERYHAEGSEDAPLRKLPVVPIPAYEDRIECQTVEELQTIRHSPNALHMEALVIRERVLGIRNPEVPHPIIFRGAVFADCAKFDRCIALWMHALALRQNNHLSVNKDLLRFTQVFSQMLHTGVELIFDHVREVLNHAVVELDRNRIKLMTSSLSGEDRISLMDEMDSNIHTVLYLLVLITKLLKNCSFEQEKSLYCEVYKLNQMGLRTVRCGHTLLHLTVSASTTVDDFHTNDVCHFPCAATARLLIQCGADVNAKDAANNTPLHLIVAYRNPVSDFTTLHSIVSLLLDAGAHMDTVNARGETPFEAATSGVAEIILRTRSELSLKCMAAKAVKKFNVAYKGQVPRALEGFIELHGVPRMGCSL